MKPTQRCIVRGCLNNISIKISLFRFPKDPTILRIWLKRIGRMDLLNKTPEYMWTNCRVCGAHFESNSFTTYKHNRLKNDAVPSIFPRTQLNKDQTVTIYREEEGDDESSSDDDDIPLDRLEIPRKDDLSTVCRGCMSTSKKHLTVLLDDTTMELFRQCTRLDADCGDGLPNAICDPCLNSCRIWSEFQAQCKYSDSELRLQYGFTIPEMSMKSNQNVCESMNGMPIIKVEVDAEPPMHMDSFVCNTCDETLYGDQYLTHVCGGDKSNEEEFPKYPFELHEGMSNKYDTKLNDDREDDNKSLIELSDDSNEFNDDNDDDDDDDGTIDRDFDSNDDSKDNDKAAVDSEDESSILDSEDEEEYEEYTGSSNRKVRPHNCNKCPLRFVALRDYKRHLNFHKMVPVIKCQKCGEIFDTTGHLTRHCKKEHPGETIANYLCTQCDKRSLTYSLLKTHINSHDRVGIMCTKCGVMVSTRAALLSHNSRKHSGREQTFKCPECFKLFDTEASIRSHRRSVHTDRAFACNICTKSFKTPFTLRTHLLTHLDKKHCEKCDRGFKMEESLVKHMAKCTGPSKKKQIRFRPRICCGICKTFFDGSRELEAHFIEAHVNEVADVREEINKHKTKGCLECGKRFFYYSDLKNHAALSHGKLDIKCEHCDKKFRSTTSLISHTARTHPEKMPAPQALLDRCKQLESWNQ